MRQRLSKEERQLLIAIVKEYDDPLNAPFRLEGLPSVKVAEKHNFDLEHLREMLRALEKHHLVSLYGIGGPWGQIRVTPTQQGLGYAYPWSRKAWDFVKADIRTIVVAVITAVIITIVTTLIIQLLD